MNRRHFLSSLPIIASCAAQRTPPTGEEWRVSTKGRYQPSLVDEELLAQARRNIETLRKGTCKVRFVQANGQPVAQQKITLTQISDAFEWGYSDAGLLERDANNTAEAAQSERVAKAFNFTTAKCYWDERWHQPIEHEQGKRIYDRFKGEIAWGRKHGLAVKGHPLIWTVPKALPEWFKALPPARQQVQLLNHISTLIEQAGPDVTLWDMANEMVWEPLLTHTAQRKWPHLEPVEDMAKFLSPLFAHARQVNSKARYGLNDYGLERTYRPEVTAEAQRKRYVEVAKRLADMGTPADALGTQAHVGEPYTIMEFKTMLDDLALAGHPVHITEFWCMPNGPEEQRQQYQQNILTLCYGHPAVSHFTFWPRNTFFDKARQATPLFEVVEKLLTKTWRTPELPATTLADGTITLNGYFGQYEATVMGKKIRFGFTSGREVVVRV